MPFQPPQLLYVTHPSPTPTQDSPLLSPTWVALGLSALCLPGLGDPTFSPPIVYGIVMVAFCSQGPMVLLEPTSLGTHHAGSDRPSTSWPLSMEHEQKE